MNNESNYLYELASYSHNKKKPPLIGVTIDMIDTRFDNDGTWYSQYPWYAIGRRYCDAIVRSGGVPIMLCYNLSNVETYSNIIDGLLITGIGSDIDPTFYGEEHKHKATVSRPMKTQFEWAIAKKTIDLNKPILGINSGMQLLNVIQGGTLYQHITEDFEGAKIHIQQNPLITSYHEVSVNKSTKFFEYVKKFDKDYVDSVESDSENIFIKTNSYHRQAIKDLGENLRINAKADDGIIEGIEMIDKDFCVGVQWNPEFFINELDKYLFNSFIDIASSRKE